jgi:hypothetical protein
VSGTDPTPEEFSRFVHLSEHLLVQKGGIHSPDVMLFDCWFWAPGDPDGPKDQPVTVPDWADTLAGSNAPGWTWCPWVSPRLLEMTEAEQQAWVEQVLARA